MHRGYVKLWRKILDNGMMQNAGLLQFWIWCLTKASHKAAKTMVGYQEVQLEPGQFIFGRKKAALECHSSERKIRTFVETLRKLENLTIKSTNKFSIISIVNWQLYQCDDFVNDHQLDQQPTSKRPANDHKQECKECKECKEEKNEVPKGTSPRTRKGNGSKSASIWLCKESWRWEGISDLDLSMWMKAYPACDIPIELEKMAVWCKSNPQKGSKKNWEKFITGWLSRSQDRGGTKGGVIKKETEFQRKLREEREHGDGRAN